MKATARPEGSRRWEQSPKGRFSRARRTGRCVLEVPGPVEPAQPAVPDEPATPVVPDEPAVPADPTPDREAPPPDDPSPPQPAGPDVPHPER